MNITILVKNIYEVEIGKLLFHIKIYNPQQKEKFTNYRYIINCKNNKKIYFFHLNNLWLPIQINNQNKYIIKIKNKININSKRFYTNIENKRNLIDCIILYGINLENKFIFKIEKNKIFKRNNFYKNYFSKKFLKELLVFYEKIFMEKLYCRVYIIELSYQAISYPNIILLNEKFFKYPLTYIYKNLPHEIFHQINGCKIVYEGNAKEFMRESLVEYIQLVFLMQNLGRNFFEGQIKEHQKISTMVERPSTLTLYSFNYHIDSKYYNTLIYGRGVLLFHFLLKENIYDISKFVSDLKIRKTPINIYNFIDILAKILCKDPTYILEHYIKSNGDFK